MDFCAHVKATLERGGKVLIPCYSIGRAQEIAVLLEQYWNAVGVAFPLVFSASAAEEANAYYRLFVQWTSASLASGESAESVGRGLGRSAQAVEAKARGAGKREEARRIASADETFGEVG